MMVPRVYGIGDLSHIITGHGYKQAKVILESMGSDLSCFVPTEAYQLALRALHEHGFTILLGDPASGKSTIAAILALGALDDGCLGALKINTPDQLNLWHPGEKQFLWVDDAFGPNQFDGARMSRWNAELGTLKAAIEGGARVVFTSRNYIWEAAKSHLKMSAFPLFKESQVVVDVHDLSEEERAQMLYNHIRRVQPQKMRQRLKPFLVKISTNKAFLPETARRLGDPLFTSKLVLSEDRLTHLVENPIEFLTEVLGQLDDASRAAIALIFLNSQTGVPSPITTSSALELVTRLMGVQSAEISRAMQYLNDSFTRLNSEEYGNFWVFRHPTVSDAFAELVAESPELVELYTHGAKLDRLFNEVVCSPTTIENSRLRIPLSLYPSLILRLKTHPLDEAFKVFLGARCDKAFLSMILETRPDILKWTSEMPSNDLSFGSRLLFIALKSWGLLPESNRLKFVKEIQEKSINWLDASLLKDKVLQQIFTQEEFSEYTERFREEWLSDLPGLFEELCGRFSSGDEVSLFVDFRDNLKIAQHYFEIEEQQENFSELYTQLDAHIEELEEEHESEEDSNWNFPSPEGSGNTSSSTANTIFDDVDD